MKLSKSIGLLSKAIGFDSIVSSIITVLLIAGVVTGIFKMHRQYGWNEVLKDSRGTYKYTAYNESYSNGVDSEVFALYKDARILIGYSDMDNLCLENFSSGNIMLYGWEDKNSAKLSEAIDSALDKVSFLKEKKSFNKKEKEALTESFKMIRYFCDNQQVIYKVRLKLKLIGEVAQSNSSLNIEVIGDGGKEYLKFYEEKFNKLKNIFD